MRVVETPQKRIEIRTLARYGFRQGGWARLIGVGVIKGPNGKPRHAYRIEFKEDGKRDLWPLIDVHRNYELRVSQQETHVPD